MLSVCACVNKLAAPREEKQHNTHRPRMLSLPGTRDGAHHGMSKAPRVLVTAMMGATANPQGASCGALCRGTAMGRNTTLAGALANQLPHTTDAALGDCK